MFPHSLTISLTDPQILDFIKSGKVETQWKFWQTYNPIEVYKELDEFCFHDIPNVNSICRPGAYDFYIKDYLHNRKLHLEKKPVPHVLPEFAGITENTFGLVIYRQQVEEIIICLTGCSPEFARKARKGYGKRAKSEIAENAGYITKAALENGFKETTIGNVLDFFWSKICYYFDRDYAYYMSVKIYMDALYQLQYPTFVANEKEAHSTHLKGLIDVSNDFYTFRKDVMEHFGEFYTQQSDMFFERAVKFAKKDLPLSAIRDALFAVSLQEYQDKNGISMLIGFLAQVHLDIKKITKAKAYSELGRKLLDPNDPDFAEDSKLFDDLDDMIRGEEWKENPDDDDE